jgi:hypothetical protein
MLEGTTVKSECSEYQEKIAASVLGDLPEGEKHALEAHLDACSCCSSERDRYARAIQQLSSFNEDEVPRHFFVHPKERASNPWRLFLQLPRRWQTAVAGAAALILLLGIAAISRLQIQSNSGRWAISFGSSTMDVSALKKEILDIAERNNREARTEWKREVQSELARWQSDRLQQVQAQLAADLASRDAGIAALMAGSAGQTREDTQKLVSNLYQIIEQQREQDLKAISLRFDNADANNALKAQQTNEILDTLLLTAEMKFQ